METYTLLVIIGVLILCSMYLYGELRNSDGYAEGRDHGRIVGAVHTTRFFVNFFSENGLIVVDKTGIYRANEDGSRGECILTRHELNGRAKSALPFLDKENV
jgi:hypothetical protein